MLQGQELIDKVYAIAVKAHEGQYRRDRKTPYIEHPLVVADKFSSPILQSIALLHDVIEDTEITKEDLLKQEIPTIVVDAVEILTKKEGEKYLDYILRIKGNQSYLNQIAILVKIEDIKHNYSTVQKNKQERYELALHILKGD